MEKMHKHPGVERENGSLRAHPISRKHKDKKVQFYHEKTFNKEHKSSQKETRSKRNALCPIDSEGYINIDLDLSSNEVKGIRLKFTRKEFSTSINSRLRRKIALQINKE